MPDFHNLKSLPPTHPMRNLPLAAIDAETRMPAAGWRKIDQSWGIAKNCYNDLASVWVDNESEWRAPVPSANPEDY